MRSMQRWEMLTTPSPCQAPRVEETVILWLQAFLKANQAIVGNKITLNVINMMSDTSDTPCTLDLAHREYFEDRFAFIQRENVY